MNVQRVILNARHCLPRLIPFTRLMCDCNCVHNVCELEDVFQLLKKCKSKSLLKKHLTEPIFQKLKRRCTPTYKSSLMDCIRSGLCNLDSGVGVYAPDPEAYCTFKEFFNPILEDYHGFAAATVHPAPCFGYGKDFPNLDPESRFIVSTRVRCGRCIDGYPFNPCLSVCDYMELENLVCGAVSKFCGEHSGQYISLAEMGKKMQKKLVNAHLLFKPNDRFLKAANALRYWPKGRGVFLNRNRTFLIWVNEEDHIRVISMQKGGDLGQVYERMIIGVESLGHYLKFSHDPRLGFLSFCPTNLGTSIRASVHMRLPSVGGDISKIDDICKTHHLQVRGTSGEYSEAKDGVYDISNKRRLGITEYGVITEVYNGIKALIDRECEACRK